MRVAELSRRTGVPVPTIKYYVRERLLPPGELTSPNQAQYGESHLRRLKLIRALIDVGRLSIAATRDVLTAVDSDELTVHKMLGEVWQAVTPPGNEDVEDNEEKAASRVVDDLIDRHGWDVGPTNPARRTLIGLVATLRDLGQDDTLDLLDDYAEAAETIAAVDINTVLHRSNVDSMLEGVAIWTVLGDPTFAALRRLAHENASGRATSQAPIAAP
jgi:DNA-binding transcriptional MerR regulator